MKEATLEDGSLVRRTALATFDPAIGIEATDDLYEVFTNGELVRTEHFVRPRATRAYTRDQARAVFEQAGFTDLEWGADFTFEDRPTDWVFTVVGPPPGLTRGASAPGIRRSCPCQPLHDRARGCRGRRP